MALKDLLNMTKTDRYTADGRDKINELQAKVTEDVTYKTGDISQKTGLQKQPDGSWAPPKGSSAAKHQKAMEGAKKVGIVNKVPAGWKKAEGVTTTPNGYVAITNGGSLFPKEGQAKREVKFIKQEDFEKGNATEGLESKSTEELTNLFNELATKSVREKSPENSAARDRVYKELKRRQKESSIAENKPAEWETKGKYQVKKFEDEKTLNNYLKENGFVEEGDKTTSFSEKGAIHETVYKKGNETLVKLTGPGINKPTIRKKSKVMEAESKPAEKELIKIPTATGHAKVDKEAYAKYANNKTSVNLGRYIDRKMAGKPISESNKFYDFVKEKIYESGQDPTPYLGQSGYSYPQGLIDMYYDEWSSKKTGDSAPRILTGDTKIRIKK